MAQNFFLKEPAPTKVQVVNSELEPLKVSVSSETGINIVSERPEEGKVTAQFDNILLLQGDGTLVPVPMNTKLTNMTTAKLDSALTSLKASYSTLVSGITAATLHYTQIDSTGSVIASVFNLKD